MNIKLVLNTPFFYSSLIIWICSSLLLLSVFVDFVLYYDNENIKNEKKSKVATWNMLLFFFVLYLIWLSRIWNINISYKYELFVNIFWLGLVIIWTIFNIIWRFYLSDNWSNHIKIYENHKLVKSWPYRIVRHPLYASLMRFWLWIWITYRNYLMIIFILLIFIPMMIYRAKQEEELLTKRFPEYMKYKKKVWLFFPKLF